MPNHSSFTPQAGTSVRILTIDGPSGSGKGTISRAVAKHLGWHLLDSGALYRLVALAGTLQGVAPDDPEGHARDRKSTRLNSSHNQRSRMPSSA